MSNFITMDWLNLRSEPVKKKGNVLGIMPPDAVVEKLESGHADGWVKVQTLIGKKLLQGYASEQYLQPTDQVLDLPDEVKVIIPEAHLTVRSGKIIARSSTEGRAYHLSEPAMVRKNLSDLGSAQERIAMIHNVIAYLDVGRSPRYAPTAANTFCNIYAHDLAYCLGAYIPRVWWNSTALPRLLRNEVVAPLYDKTVVELSANSITNWFESYGYCYDWKQAQDLTGLQETVNKGTLGIIVAQNTNLNRSGHIVGVVPEKPNLSAKQLHGRIVSPLQSQAGRVNRKYFTGNWWENPGRFRKFGFWVWDIF